MTRSFEAALELVIEPDPDDGVKVISVRGELVATSCDQLRQAVEAAIASRPQPPLVVLDCRRLLHIDTPGLALVYRTQERCRSIGGEFAVAGLPERFTELVDELYIGDHVRFCDTIEAAWRLPR